MKVNSTAKTARKPRKEAERPCKGASEGCNGSSAERSDCAPSTEGGLPGHGPRLMDLHSAAKYMGRSEWGMRRLAYARKIRVVREPGGRKLYFDRRDLDAFISENKGLYA